MPRPSRRDFVVTLLAAAGTVPDAARASGSEFADAARRHRDEAVARGDQPYGAVLVLGDTIVGHGPSRVVSDADPNAHAERVALWDAQKRLGRADLTGATIYATSVPCAACQTALAAAGVARMRVGASAEDRGPPLGIRGN